MPKVPNHTTSRANFSLSAAIHAKYSHFDASTLNDIAQDARIAALEVNPLLTGNELDVAAAWFVEPIVTQKRDAYRRGDRVAQGTMTDAGTPESLAPRRRPRKLRAPDKPENSLPVTATSWWDLTDYLFPFDEGTSERIVPGWFLGWCERVERGDHSAFQEHPELLSLAEQLARITSLTSFEKWRQGSNDMDKRVPLRDALQRWFATIPEAEGEYRAALSVPFLWLPGTCCVGYAPVRTVSMVSPKVHLAAQLLNERVIQRLLQQPLTPELEQNAIHRAFVNAFGIDVDEAWILLLLDEVEEARRSYMNTELRAATLPSAEQARFGPKPSESSLHILASTALERTHARLAQWSGEPRPALPPWLTPEIVAWLIMRYGYDSGGGGGAKGTISRQSMTRLLKMPRKLLRAILKHGDRIAERAGDENARVIEANYRRMTEQLTRMTETGAAEQQRTARPAPKQRDRKVK